MNKVIRYKGINPIKDLYLLEKELMSKVQEYNEIIGQLHKMCPSIKDKEEFKKLVLKKEK